MVNADVVKDFNLYPAIVAKVAELLAEGRSVCVIIGDRCAVATTWDRDILAMVKKVELEPKHEDGSLGYLCWDAAAQLTSQLLSSTAFAAWLSSAFSDHFTSLNPPDGRTAIACISKCPPRNSDATPTNCRAGRSFVKYVLYAALNLS